MSESSDDRIVFTPRRRPFAWVVRHPEIALIIALALYPVCCALARPIGALWHGVPQGQFSGYPWVPTVNLVEAPGGYRLSDPAYDDGRQIGFFAIYRLIGARPGILQPHSHYAREQVQGRWYRDGGIFSMSDAELERLRGEAVEFWLAQGEDPAVVQPLATPLVEYDRLYWPGIVIDGAIVWAGVLVLVLLIYYGGVQVGRMSDNSRLARGQCPRCRYPIGGLPEPRCPECGTTWIVDDEEQGGSESDFPPRT